MKKIGITGQTGFIGWHLSQTIDLFDKEFELVIFHSSYFESEELLKNFVQECDVIVHLAAMNRHENPQVIYDTNISLVNKLVTALDKTNKSPHVIFSSSSQEEKDNLYGRSKREGRQILSNWAEETDGKFTGLIIPNVFGPFGRPFYNSVVATFCHLLTSGGNPRIEVDGTLQMIYVGDIVQQIINIIRHQTATKEYVVPATKTITVSGLLGYLNNYKQIYLENGEIPVLMDAFEQNLFNTFRSFINYTSHFPVLLKKNIDQRGSFVEIVRLGIGGQVSFSTTLPGIIRGNHFHTRKIERFTVIKGKALIQLRKIDTDEIIEFRLDGDTPAYVDMPVWYTHSIKNIGDNELFTVFWINEAYDPQNADTYFVAVNYSQ